MRVVKHNKLEKRIFPLLWKIIRPILRQKHL